MVELLTPDICVIGAGLGGLNVAAGAAAFGVPVVLIEKGKMGGECLHTGCVPSKSLIAAARHAHAIAGAKRFGLSVRDFAVDFAGVHKHVHDVIAAIEPDDSKARFTGLGVRVIKERAPAFRMATRSWWAMKSSSRRGALLLQPAPLRHCPPFRACARRRTSPTRRCSSLPSGPSISSSSAPAQWGSTFPGVLAPGLAVTVLEAGQPLAREDPECAQVVLDALAQGGCRSAAPGAAVARVQAVNGRVNAVVRAQGGEENIAGTHLLLATGRRANTEGLGLDEAGIRQDRAGIVVNKGLKTTNRRVYAIGDVAGGAQFTHLANHEAGLVIRNAFFRLPVRINEHIVPRVTFTDPELAHVGLTEVDARDRRTTFRVLS